MAETIHLRAPGVSLVLLVDDRLRIAHWGAELGDDDLEAVVALAAEGAPQTGIDEPAEITFWREAARGHLGRPAVAGSRAGLGFSPLFTVSHHEAADGSAHIEAVDADAELAVRVRFTLSPEGVLRVEQSLSNTGSTPYELIELGTWLPLPDRTAELLDFTGRWLRERQPQRRRIDVGLSMRELREGRPGHESSIVHLAMTAGATFQTGSVWAIGHAWSGNGLAAVERTAGGSTAFGVAELLLPGEVRLAPGDTYDAPAAVAVYSTEGIDGASDRFHRWLRARPSHPSTPRPLTLNVWEAVYFDHSIERLLPLVDAAAEIGVERFVLDDGWFLGRRDDTAGLGDWEVDPEVWPDGLHELSARVVGSGMQFGLWFEGEMVNPRSRVAAEHPDWLLRVPGRLPPEMRSQQVLDLVNEDAWAHVHGQVDAILRAYPISYIKWDHNRFLVDPGHAGLPAVRAQTLAIYRLFDSLRADHPGLEIESCASGGGRIDLGMVEHADRFWTSDSNDALERQSIQRYTAIAIPPELLGTHIGPAPAHSTGRAHTLSFRAITALFGHAGLEWDLTETTAEERERLSAWAAYYKRNRELLHSGRVLRVDSPDPAAHVHGVVAHDRARAIVAYVQLGTAAAVIPPRVLIPSLDPDARYRVSIAEPAGRAMRLEKVAPLWTEGVVATGRALAEFGLRPPVLHPESAILIELDRM